MDRHGPDLYGRRAIFLLCLKGISDRDDIYRPLFVAWQAPRAPGSGGRTAIASAAPSGYICPMPKDKRQRADQLAFEQGLAESREQAAA